MNKYLLQVYNIIVPKPVRTKILRRSIRKEIISMYSSIPREKITDEQREIIRYLESNRVRIFPYSYHDNYSPDKVEVFHDHDKGLRYVLQDGKKLYFKKRWGVKRIQRAYSALAREQDINSPHRYLTELFKVDNSDVIADIGAAEGNFSLSVIDKAKKIYLFEHDSEWDEALRASFAPWPDKVEIINKYVADFNDESHIILDDFNEKNKDINFLKIDVDGEESVVLNGCNRILNSDLPLRIALCTYHRQNDEDEFTVLLNKYGFTITPSRGYMINYYDKELKSPWLRRGLIRAVR